MLFILFPGEHIDYSLFGCFPAAIERDILIACAPRSVRTSHSPYSQTEPDVESQQVSGSVVAENLHGKYSRQTFVPARKLGIAGTSGAKDISEDAVHVEEWHLEIDTKQLRWESYVKAGYYVGVIFVPVPFIICSTKYMTTQGVLNHYFTPAAGSDDHPVPVDILVTGSVPAGSGLSSSAAMVVASTLAFLAVNGKLDDTNISAPRMTKGKLVEMAMENEKRVGK